jgi:outer membrane protein assembly factor BamB
MRKNILIVSVIGVLGYILFQGALAQAVAPNKAPLNTWPQWRGPARDGLVTGAVWPRSLDERHLTRLWRVEIAEGYSGPIISKDRVFTVETKDRSVEIVRAFDRRSGKQLWSSKWTGSISVPFFAWRNGSWVRSTPALDGDRLYVGGMRDVLVCLNAKTGKEIWRVDFVKRLKAAPPGFGFVASPLVMGAHVYVQAGAAFVKLDKMTGKVVWRTLEDDGGMYGSAFSSAYPATLAGMPQILVQTRQILAGIADRNGKVLWQRPVKAFRGMNILTPVTSGDRVFTSSYGGGSVALDIKKKPTGGFVSAIAWKTGVQAYMCSPIVISGHAYLLLRNQRLTCIDLSTGKEAWTERQRFGKYMSLASNGKSILGLDQRGELVLFEANPAKFVLLDRRKATKQETWAHIAVAGDKLFIRELKAISCWKWAAPAGKQ